MTDDIATVKGIDYNPFYERQQADFLNPEPAGARLYRSIFPAAVPTYTLGVDLSHWNGDVNFTMLKAGGYDFAIIKASEGINIIDSKFLANTSMALDAGLVVGVYHFFRSNLDGIAQADHFLNVTALLRAETGGAVIPCGDLETADGVTQTTRRARYLAFLTAIQSEFKTPTNYSSAYLWNLLIGNVAWANDFHQWPASWTSAPAPTLPAGWSMPKVKVWQYGVSGKYTWCPPSVPGVAGACDVNRFYGTLDELRTFAGYTGPSDTEKLALLWDAHPELHG